MERYFGVWYKSAEAKPPHGGEYIVALSSGKYGMKPVIGIRKYNPVTNEWSKKRE